VRAQTKLDWTGPGDLRKLFCSRFQPRGADVDQDPERANFERDTAETDRRIAEWKKEQKLLGEPPAVIDVTPAIRTIDRTTADLRFERTQQFLGKESKPIYIPGTAKRSPEERAGLVREIETKLGINAPLRRFGYCSAFEEVPGSSHHRFTPNLPVGIQTTGHR
jgi:hypothetical protein